MEIFIFQLLYTIKRLLYYYSNSELHPSFTPCIMHMHTYIMFSSSSNRNVCNCYQLHNSQYIKRFFIYLFLLLLLLSFFSSLLRPETTQCVECGSPFADKTGRFFAQDERLNSFVNQLKKVLEWTRNH